VKDGIAAMDEASGLIGRRDELATLLRLADPSRPGEVVLLSGDAGTGKTTLLRVVIDRARAAGMRVLSAAAARSERDVDFAGLHALLDAQRSTIAALPPRHRDPLLALLGVAGNAAPTDRLPVGVATLTLLRALAADAPLLVVVDDVQWLDEKSLAAVTFAARRLTDGGISVVLAGREDMIPDGLNASITELRLGPLSIDDAARLLDQRSSPPSRLAREQVLAQSAGNPAALVELGALVSTDEPGSRYAIDPLPLPKRLAAAYASPLSALPESTRTALLVASAASAADLAAVAGRLALLNIDTLSAAELAGLITVGPAGIAFVHPLMRSAAYYGAPFAARADAHRELAAVLGDQPDRRAWHLSKATLGRDEQVAALLEATHQQAQQRCGFIAAAAAMERAAELSPQPADQARRLVGAAGLSRFTGDISWPKELANRALAITADPLEQSKAHTELAWTLSWTNHHETALAVALPLAGAATTDANVPWEGLRTAATVTYQAGTTKARRAVAAALDELERDRKARPDGHADQHYADSTRLFTRLVVDPHGGRVLISQIRELADAAVDPFNVGALGIAAWLADESEFGLRLIRRSAAELQAQGAGRQSPAVLTALASAYVDVGRWDEALSTCAELGDMALARGQPFLGALGDLAAATVLAWRGEVSQARARLASALGCFDPDDSRAAGSWAHRAAGLISLAEDSDIAAYLQLRRLFAEDGTAFHYHASYPGLADLAEAAVRSEQSQEARDVIDRALARLDAEPSPRMAQLFAYARALLAEQADAERWFVTALADAAGEQWPFERARVRLGYGEWLRRQRRIAEAKQELTRANSVFESLQAAPWITRAAREIRAAGIRVAGSTTGLGDLSPQEHQVVYFAGQGLSNREIGQLLNLSPRTVGAHLYRAFPKLGVTNRRQIRDIPPPDDAVETSAPLLHVADSGDEAAAPA
jgi:DNA-binding CsgD family transcriptional regulator